MNLQLYLLTRLKYFITLVIVFTILIQNTFIISYSLQPRSTLTKIPNTYSFSVILVEFSDVKHSTNRKSILEKLQELNNYIVEASYGLYSLEIYLTNEWYLLSNTIEFYDKNIWHLLKDSIEISDIEVDFSRYPRVVIVHAGHNEAYSKFEKDIRSQYINVHCGAPIKTNDGVLISSAIIISEHDPLGVIVHEFLHMFGAIDLYLEGEVEGPIGPWDPMATGHTLGAQIIDNKYLAIGTRPPHPSSWTKIKIGWFRDSDILILGPGEHTIEIKPLGDPSEGIHAVKIPVTSTKYYLIEVREKKGFDSDLPDEGFLLYKGNKEAVNIYAGIIALIDSIPQTSTLNDAPYKHGQKYVDEEHNLILEFYKVGTKYILKVTYKAPDLVIENVDQILDTNITLLQVHLNNRGNTSIKQAILYFFVNGHLYNKTFIRDILPNQKKVLTYVYNNKLGSRVALFEARLIDDVIEYDENNNKFLMYLRFPGEKEKTIREWNPIPLPKNSHLSSYSLQTGNIDEDSMEEIIVQMRGWPSSLVFFVDNSGLLINKREDCSTILIEDLDYDDVNEVLCISEEEIKLQSSTGYLRWNIKNFINSLRNSLIYPNQYRFIDINMDGVKDIVMLVALNPRKLISIYGGHLHVYESLKIYVINGKDGSLLKNFIVTSEEGETFEFEYYMHLGNNFIGDYGLIDVKDIDGDGKLELVMGLFSNDMATRWYSIKSFIVYVYTIDGLLLWRKEFPVRNTTPVARIFIENFSSDEKMEILFSYYFYPEIYLIYLLNWKGEVIWHKTDLGSNPLIVAASQKGIIISQPNMILAVDPVDGSIKWSFRVYNEEDIIISTVGVFSQLNRIFFSTNKHLYLLDENGNQVSRITFGMESLPILDPMKESLIVRFYEDNTLWRVNLRNGEASIFFSTITFPSLIKLINLDTDLEFEYVILGSILEVYDSNGSLMWTFGLGHFRYGTPLDLDNDGLHDAVFVKAVPQESLLHYSNGKTIYSLEDCGAEDLNGDGFSEVVCASHRGLEVYDMMGNLVWKVPGADFRQISIAELPSGKKLIAVSVGIFARRAGFPPQVRIYSDSGKLISVIGSYWDPPCVKILRSNTTRKPLILVIGPWGRGEYHLEVYDIEERLVFNRIISEEVWRRCKPILSDFNEDGKEDIILEPYVFSLNGELLSNTYRMPAKKTYLLIADIDSDGEEEKILSLYPFNEVEILDRYDNLKSKINLKDIEERIGLIVVKSGKKEITLLVGTLTTRGYVINPLKYYHVQVESQYGNIKEEGWYRHGATVAINIVNDIIELGNGTRRVFISWKINDGITINSPSLILRINSSMSLIANWKTQYYLTVKSRYGITQGEGWYDEGSLATFSVTPTIIGFPIRHVFKGWYGDSNATSNRATIIMDEPKTVVAIWETDYSQFILILVITLVVFAIIILILLLKRLFYI